MLRVMGFGVSRHRSRRHDSSLNILSHNTLRGYIKLTVARTIRSVEVFPPQQGFVTIECTFDLGLI